MYNKILILVAIISLSLLTSCQKEEMAMDHPTIATTDQLEIPVTDVEPLKGTITTFEKNFSKSVNRTKRPTRGWAFQPAEANARNSQSLNCDEYIKGSTMGGTNHFGNNMYLHFGLPRAAVNFEGNDFYALFKAHEVMDQKFVLDAHVRGMSLFLFKIEENCFQGNCTLTIVELVDFAINLDNYNTTIYAPNLSIGRYLLIVDAPVGTSGKFVIDRFCKASIADKFCYLQDQDGFGTYKNGDLCEQSCHWTKWNENAAYDAQVSGDWNPYLGIKRKIGVRSEDQPDVLLHIDDSYKIKKVQFKMWIPRNRSAEFNLQKEILPGNVHNEVGAVVRFNRNKQGEIYIQGKVYEFRYRQNDWIDITIEVDKESDLVTIDVDHEYTAKFPGTWGYWGDNGNTSLKGINFYPSRSDSEFYLENVAFKFK